MMVKKQKNPILWQLNDEERRERLFLPWRRLFARKIDFIFYILLYWTVAYLVFHWNALLLHWIPFSAILFAAGLALMILLEPVFLSVFGTTPGKAVFGIRLRTSQGSKLSLKQSYIRLFRVMTRGCGFVIVPGYNFVRMFKSCKSCQVEGVTEWDKDSNYMFKGGFYARITLGVISMLITAVLLAAVYYIADMPKLRGNLTVTQLETNVNDYWKFHGTAWNTELFSTINLQFYETSIGYIFDRMDPPEVSYEETNGFVTGVSFQFTDAPRIVLMALPVWIRCYSVSFIGAQDNISFFDMHTPGGALDSILTPVLNLIDNREGSENVELNIAGVNVSYRISAGDKVSVYFSLRKS